MMSASSAPIQIDPGQQYWDERLETLVPARRQLLREHRLHWQVRRCWDGSPFYRARLEAAGIEPSTFGGLADWARLPILREADLPATADWAVAPDSWWDHLDEAPGHPTRVVTDGDAIQQMDLAARALWAAGARPSEPLPNGVSGLSILTRPDVVRGAERIQADLRDTDLEQFSPRLAWPAGAPLVFLCHECEAAHWNEDHFLIELVDPASGLPVPPGAPGVVVVTDLAREGSPLLRYVTGQAASALSKNACSCGRTLAHSRRLGSPGQLDRL